MDAPLYPYYTCMSESEIASSVSKICSIHDHQYFRCRAFHSIRGSDSGLCSRIFQVGFDFQV